MLRHLRVTNFAILSDVEIELGPGMNVLTGETGAGKSLIVEAVNLLRGGRASADIPRAGTDEAVVEAIVEVPDDLQARVNAVLDGAGIPRTAPDADDSSIDGSGDAHEVFIRRVIQRGGRSRTYVNGALTTAARLAELGALLIDLSGQHQHQGLVDPSRHRELLDTFGASEPLAAAMTEAWSALRRCDEALAVLGGDERQREARIDYLKFQLEELDAGNFTAGEEPRVEVERVRLASVDLLSSAARAAEDVLYGSDDSARDRVAAAAREVERAVRTDPTLEPVGKQLTEIETLIDDAATQLRAYADRLEGDPERLAFLDERIALIRRLVRKHAATNLDDVIAKTTALRTELDSLTGRDASLAELSAARTNAEVAAVSAATVLTAARKKAARKLEKEVGAALAELGMASAKLVVSMEKLPALNSHGADKVELVLQPNKGEEARPLVKIASGGELSRIMLAIKLGLQSAGRAEYVATYVFDEVDTGIGGATAQVVGSQIRVVAGDRVTGARGRQVLCVTHLPQIAAFADQHFHVEKAEVNGRTETHVRKLNAAARKDELARMLGGQATSKARAHAAELLADAAKPRKSAASSRAS